MSQWRNVTDLLQEVEMARIDSELTRFVFETPEPREPTGGTGATRAGAFEEASATAPAQTAGQR